MTLRELITYCVACDTCGRTFGMFDGATYPPQRVLRIMELEYGWHIDDETAICVGCPQPTDISRDKEHARGQG